MPATLALVLSGFRKQSILFVRTVAKVSDIVYGVFSRVMSYMVNMLLVWASNRHQEMICYKAVYEHFPTVRHNLLPQTCVLYRTVLTANPSPIANGDYGAQLTAAWAGYFNPKFFHMQNIVI